MSEPFLGEITLFGGNFAPRGWAFCDGQLLSIGSNSALFSLLGTTYGGDGRTTFGLPDLRGRAPLHLGQGPGLSSRTWGSRAGSENVALTSNEIPAHTHVPQASAAEATAATPAAGQALADSNTAIYGTATPAANLAASAVGNTGGNQGHNNMMPYLTLNYCIALQGVFPSRN